MGRELQKRKNRSGLSKVRHKPASKRKILSNPIIAANWNQKETLSQNYRRLGLVSKLNSRGGGQDDVSKLENEAIKGRGAGVDALVVNKKIPVQEIEVGEARLERDEEGNLVVVEDKRKPNPLNDPLNELEASEEEEWQGIDNMGFIGNPSSSTSVVAALEAEARNGVKKAPRKQSQREEEWIERLVGKYGDDYGKMARDLRLNPMQQTAADIRRRVEKWRKKQG